MERRQIKEILIAGLLPDFLEKPVFWFQENKQKILRAAKTRLFFKKNILFLEKDQIFRLSELLRKLDEFGYEKVEKAEDIGEFSHKGSLVEIFPVNSNHLFRIEFFGNAIETIEIIGEDIDEKSAKKRLKKKLKSQRIFSGLKGLKTGDFVVHLDHGVAKFLGKEQPEVSNKEKNAKESAKIDANQSYYLLEYAQDDKLYVPVGLERKLSAYAGFAEPKISRLNSPLWQKIKRKAREKAAKMAKELLAIYAKREIAARPPWANDSEIDRELISNFPFEETRGQTAAIAEIKQDLRGKKPMDRIICGDAGFGKTETALRTMVKAAVSGQQSAMICPTTILADQHYQNFRQRIKKLPLKIELLSRLQTKGKQKEILIKLKSGEIDIVIGTHRLLAKDIQFKNLQLLVIDEEQRFGVRQKEKFKKARAQLDILSLSATPIPRTLYLALSSLRNISFIQTAPPGRKIIKTKIAPWSGKIVKEAIEFELARGGQVYYLCAKIEGIAKAKMFLEQIMDKNRRAKTWRIGILHGRMKEREIISAMANFKAKKVDILVVTTIIETGIDFANVNTLITADASRLGLAQAYQIRGRIGRSPIQAFAYFLYPKRLSAKASLRLKALKETEELGAGYKIAKKDLEIRGAGNILGKEQAGSVNAVGLNLYCQMIAAQIEKIKNP